jgi:hypothetical protein
VEFALAEIGRAFGAARSFELARQGRLKDGDRDSYIGGFPFRRWNRAERQIAPPLVVELDGHDAQACGLAEFLVGRQKIVLVVRDECPPALLARLITPAMFVMQTHDVAELAEIALHDGPAIAALVPESAARFVHRPGKPAAWERLEVKHLPAAPPRMSIGRYSTFQQSEELELLRALAEKPADKPVEPLAATNGAQAGTAAAAAAPPAAAPADPADRLAAWLLSQADLGNGA